MSVFAKENFEKSGHWLYYNYNGQKKFVARFKYRNPFTMTKFKNQLMKNHTPVEYFSKLDQGETPLGILRDADMAWYFNILEKNS